MTLDSLKALCAIVEAGNFRKAASALHRSQPAISQQLKNLEDELGQELIERRSCRLTPLGELVHQRAQSVLAGVRSLEQALDDFQAAPQVLRLGTSDTTALYFLPPVLRRFLKHSPDTRLVMVNRSSDAIADQVARMELDLGIVTLPLAHPALEEQVLFEQRLVLVTPRKHPLTTKRRIRLNDLAEEPLLLLHAQMRTGRLLREYFAAEGFTPNVLLDSGSFEVIKRYVAEGIGVSFLPEAVVTPEDKHLQAIPMPGLPTVPIGAIWRKGAYRSKAQEAFLELLRR
jgi:LysR family cyn operon transcriptional activator